MKKSLFLILSIYLAFSCNSFAQKKLDFGIKVGSSISSMAGADDLAAYLSETMTEFAGEDFPISQSPRYFLFNCGVSISYNAFQWLSLKGGIDYSPKGEKFYGELYLSTSMNMVSQVLTSSTIIKLSYVEFPLIMQFSTRSKKKVGKTYLYLDLGICPAINISSKMDVTTTLLERGFDSAGVTEDIIESDNQVTTIEGIKSTDLGMIIGVGVGVKKMFFDLRFIPGLNDITEEGDEEVLKNGTITLSMGFIF